MTPACLRVVAIHAHPDDETLFTGSALAAHAVAGAETLLITLTLGEAAELPSPINRHLQDLTKARHRRLAKLDSACQLLGIDTHIRLGGDGRWVDYGRDVVESTRALSCADRSLLIDELVEILHTAQPALLLTVGQDGVTQHPDHILVHQIVMEACRMSFGDKPPKERPVLLGSCVSLSDVERARRLLARYGVETSVGSGGIRGVPESDVHVAIGRQGVGKFKQLALDHYLPGLGSMAMEELLPRVPRLGDGLFLRAIAESSAHGWDAELFQVIDYVNENVRP